MTSQKFYHGGYGGLCVGQSILPPSMTRAASTASYGAAAVCDRDKVYVTTDYDAALGFACAHPSGRGKLYEVEPVGDLEDDPDARKPGYSFQCERARIAKVFRVKGKLIKIVQKALLAEAR